MLVVEGFSGAGDGFFMRDFVLDGVRIAVIDHGIGISADDRQKIFKPFGRAVSSRHFGGLGMGLYIVKQLVEAHGGCIDVTSDVDSGTCFAVTLPRAPADADTVRDVAEDVDDVVSVRGL